MKEYDIRPEIEIFDLSHIHAAKRLIDEGLMNEPAARAVRHGRQERHARGRAPPGILLAELKRVIPDATWTAAGIGRLPERSDALGAGTWRGHLRTGLEDNIRVSKDRLASSNAELVKIAADLCAEYDARPATVAEARQLLAIRSA